VSDNDQPRSSKAREVVKRRDVLHYSDTGDRVPDGVRTPTTDDRGVLQYNTARGLRYEVRWDLPDLGTGKRRQRSKSGFDKLAEARKHLRGVQADQDKGKVSVRSTQSLADACRAWLDSKRITTNPRTGKPYAATALDNWRVALEVHVIPRLGSLRVSDVTHEHVRRLYLDVSQHGKAVRHGTGADGKPRVCRTAGVTCRDFDGCSAERHAGLAPKSLSHVHAALRAVLAEAVDAGELAVNPCDHGRVKRVRPSRKATQHEVTERDYWTDDQARSFLAACERDGDPLRVLWTAALATGLRRGELAALTWACVDLDGGSLYVAGSTTSVRGQAVTTDGKSSNARRRVPLPATVAEVLREHRKAQRAAKLAAEPGDWIESDHVFTHADGSPVHPQTMSRRFPAAVKRAAVPSVGLHGCRHYAASSMIRAGVPVTTVSRVLGHESAAITLAIYAHAFPADDDRAAEAMERALWGAA
jgi:integrase